VCTRGAGRDGEEFVEGQDSRLAAFPTCTVSILRPEGIMGGLSDTFLSLVEFWRAGVICAGLGLICVNFSTPFVDAFLRHDGRLCESDRFGSD
jgi:hypothetical protein